MPGTPAFSTRLAAPRYADTDPANFAPQVNAILDRIDESVAKDAPRVSVLPSSPIDGEEVVFASTAMAAVGVEWRLRYRAGSAHARKWEYVGGPDFYNANTNTNVLNAVGSWTDPTTGLDCPLLCPLSGDYFVTTGFYYAVATPASGESQSILSGGIAVAGATPPDARHIDAPVMTAAVAGTYPETGHGFAIVTLDAATTYGIRYYRYVYNETAGTTYSIQARRLGIRPIRVG